MSCTLTRKHFKILQSLSALWRWKCGWNMLFAFNLLACYPLYLCSDAVIKSFRCLIWDSNVKIHRTTDLLSVFNLFSNYDVFTCFTFQCLSSLRCKRSKNKWFLLNVTCSVSSLMDNLVFWPAILFFIMLPSVITELLWLILAAYEETNLSNNFWVTGFIPLLIR